MSSTRQNSCYTRGPNRIALQDASGSTVVGSPYRYDEEATARIDYGDAGFDLSSPPILVHMLADEPFADSRATPTETDVRASAAYMGWNASLGELQIHSSTSNEVRVYDGRTSTELASFSMRGGEIFTGNIAELGFDPDEPFLAVVEADEPVYQQVKIPYYLRQYAGELGPVLY